MAALTPLQRTARWAAVLLPLGMAAATAFLAWARWPRYWLWIALEETPFTFLKALLLYTTAGCAAVLALTSDLAGRPRAERRGWWLVALGFLYLMADDRFAFHERIRDHVLAPLGWRLPWGAPGDYVTLVYFLIALLMLPTVMRLYRPHPLAARLLVAAVALAGAAFAADSVNPFDMPVAVERLEQTLEEAVKGLADAFFAASAWAVLAERLEHLARRGREGAAGETGHPLASGGL